MKWSYEYGKESKTTICTLKVKDKVYQGCAFCHDDDKPYASRATGEYIAQNRCLIKYYQDLKKEITAKKKVLEDFYKSLLGYKKFDVDSYCAHRLLIEIDNYNLDIEILTKAILVIRKNLKDYLDAKEERFKAYREEDK